MKRVHKILVAATSSLIMLSISIANTEEEIPAGQMIDGVELPAWQEEYAVGHFDTRLWPEALVQKVEIDLYATSRTHQTPHRKTGRCSSMSFTIGKNRMTRADKRSATTC